MKMLVCRRGCARMFVALGTEPLDCGCGTTGGAYNADLDTVTVWGEGVLIGLSNKALFAAVNGANNPGEPVFLYSAENGKVTRLTARPASPGASSRGR